jgi:acyl-CoA thioesterase I
MFISSANKPPLDFGVGYTKNIIKPIRFDEALVCFDKRFSKVSDDETGSGALLPHSFPVGNTAEWWEDLTGNQNASSTGVTSGSEPKFDGIHKGMRFESANNDFLSLGVNGFGSLLEGASGLTIAIALEVVQGSTDTEMRPFQGTATGNSSASTLRIIKNGTYCNQVSGYSRVSPTDSIKTVTASASHKTDATWNHNFIVRYDFTESTSNATISTNRFANVVSDATYNDTEYTPGTPTAHDGFGGNGNMSGFSFPFDGWIRGFVAYPFAATDAEMLQLHSWMYNLNEFAREDWVNALAGGQNLRMSFMGGSLSSYASGVNDYPYPSMLGDSLKREARETGALEIFNESVSGQNSASGVSAQLPNVLAQNPDVVFIEFSVNDSHDTVGQTLTQHEANIKQIIDDIRAKNPDCMFVILTMSEIDHTVVTDNSELDEYYKLDREIAKDRGATLVDNFADTWEPMFRDNNALYEMLFYDHKHHTAEAAYRYIVPNIKKAFNIEHKTLSDYATLHLWLSASDNEKMFTDTSKTTLVTGDGDQLASITCQADNVATIQQSVAAQRPTLISRVGGDTTGLVNGFQSIAMTKADTQHFDISNSLSNLVGVDYKIFFAFQLDSYDTSGGVIFLWLDTGVSGTSLWARVNSDTLMSLRPQEGTIASQDFDGAGAPFLCVWENVTGTGVNFRVNGSQLANNSSVAYSMSSVAKSGLLGKHSSVSHNVDGKLLEIVVTGAISNDARDNIENEIMDKYAIS